MMEAHIRPVYQRYCVDPLVLHLSRGQRLTPNHITFLGTVIGVASAVMLALNDVILAILLLLGSGYLDTLDGSLARARGRATAKGAVLDIMSDRLVEVAIVLGLFFVSPESRGLLCCAMLGSILLCVTSFLVVGVFSNESSQKSFFYSPGLIERPEAFVFFFAMILLPKYFNEIAIAFSGLVLYTAFRRVYDFCVTTVT